MNCAELKVIAELTRADKRKKLAFIIGEEVGEEAGLEEKQDWDLRPF